jgi:hypothetical protein
MRQAVECVLQSFDWWVLLGRHEVVKAMERRIVSRCGQPWSCGYCSGFWRARPGRNSGPDCGSQSVTSSSSRNVDSSVPVSPDEEVSWAES